MPSPTLTPDQRQTLAHIVGSSYVQFDALDDYSHDWTEDLRFYPQAVVQPRTTEEVSRLMRYCYEENIPVTPRGAGTGLSGGALPVRGGVVLSIARMNEIVAIDEENLQVVTQPGVITQHLQESVARKGLFYPPDPSSKGSCLIGGNVAENAGGPKAVKYGVTQDYVLNLEVVLADGTVIWTGANVLKNATGFNLTQLMVGSEGTLGVVTQMVLKLIPMPQHRLLMKASFADPADACRAVAAIFRSGRVPSALEFMEKSGLEYAAQYLGQDRTWPPEAAAQLLIEVEGNHLDALYADCELIDAVLQQHGVLENLFAETVKEQEELWRLRRIMGEAVHAISTYKEEDTVVPRARLADLLQTVKAIGARYGFESVCYGHAGDGNLHVNILKGRMDEQAWNETVKHGIREIFQQVVAMGGTLSGEHGIGWVQREYMDIAFSERSMELMRGIKALFDPKGTLNPDKIFPSEQD